jgi:iron complex outermembrane receptor protein
MLTARADSQLGTSGGSRDFTTISASLGGQYEVAPGWRAGLSLSHSERAPSIDELYANGPHGGSQSFEAGDSGLAAERGDGAELSLHHTSGPVHLTANAYYTRFASFIFQAPTGAVVDDLPVMQFRQGKADYYGFEVQSDARLGQAFGIDWGAELQADAVHATVEHFGPAPLIPPLRALGALTGTHGEFDGRVEIEHAFDHTRTSPLETATPGYTLVNLTLDWHPLAADPALTLSLAGSNLLDAEARRSTSLLKDFAPLAGRDVRLSARLNF